MVKKKKAKKEKREVICHVQEDMKNLNKDTSKNITLVIKNIPTKKSLKQVASLANSTKMSEIYTLVSQ